MPERRRRPLTVTLLLAAATMAGTGLVQAEVVGPKPTGPSATGLTIHEEPVRLECWQNGRRIIEERDLGGLAVKAITQSGAVTFKQFDDEQPDIVLLPFDDSLCLVAPDD